MADNGRGRGNGRGRALTGEKPPNGDPQRRPVDPQRRPGDPQRQPGDPQRRPGDPQRRPGDPQRQPGDPQRRPGDPQRGPGDPQRRPGDPQRRPGDPQRRPGDPQREPGDSRRPSPPSEQTPRLSAPPGVRPRDSDGSGAIPKRPRTESFPSTSAGTSSMAGVAGAGEGSRTGPSVGRSRGRRLRIGEIVKCRPENVKEVKVSDLNDAERGCKLVANYFRVTSTPNWSVYQYHVTFEPEIEGTRIKRILVNAIKVELNDFIFDGTSLYCMQTLGDDPLERKALRPGDGLEVKMTFKHVKTLHNDDPILLQVMNIQQRKNFRHMGFSQLNRYYYDPRCATTLPHHNLEIWPGFMSSIARYENQVLLNAELTFKLLRRDTVLQLLNTIRQNNAENYRDESTRTLVDSIILTRYNNRTYKISDIDWNKSPSSTFPKKDGSLCSFVDYYLNTWRLTITNPTQPLLVARPSRREENRGMVGPILLIPELCVLTGISDETRKNFKTMQEIVKSTRANPTERVSKLLEFMTRIKRNQNAMSEMRKWNVDYDDSLVKINGRLLKAEQVVLGKETKLSFDRHIGWMKLFRECAMHTCVHLKNWLLVYSSNCERESEILISNLKRVCPPMGVRVDDPQRVCVRYTSADEYVTAIRKNFNRNLQLVFCLVPDDNKSRYDAIKKTCCIELPVPSQIARRPNLFGAKGVSVCTKIGIQMNCKLGGAAWSVVIPMNNVMVVGYDAYRDSTGRGRMVGALCCSMNKSMTQYYSRVSITNDSQDMIDGLVQNFAAGLRKFKEKNGCFPNRVIFYRDGVSEGQLMNIRDNEVIRLVDTFRESGIEKPQFTFIVVTKRHGTKIMEAQTHNAYNNPTPGTVVDSEITRPEWYDFFLVSQSVGQGTVSPTHYNILHDTSALKPSHMQRLTYKLTHLYYNWPGTIRVPAPCLYAYKLAFLTSQSLHSQPSESLADTLFYL